MSAAAVFACDRVPTPIGDLLVAVDGDALAAAEFADCEARLRRFLGLRAGRFELRAVRDPAGVRSALDAYFGGDPGAIDALAVRAGGTPFQERAWAALRAIPPGSTRSYGEMARQLGRPRAARAIGHANGRNPVAVVVPCHRLVGADGRLTGYAGGLERKRWLLAHERGRA